MKNAIVILGWGSLIYELCDLKKNTRLPWFEGGPKLPIEFSRISSSRDRALTLVIDPVNGIKTPTMYIQSTRKDPRDTVCDLRDREGTVIRRIGMVDLKNGSSRSKYPDVLENIKAWGKEKEVRAVIWTDLPSKEESNGKKDFSILAAIEHLKSLADSELEEAKYYIRNAPDFVNTPLRQKLISENWY